MKKLPLVFLGLCLVYWGVLAVVRVSAETATLNASGGNIYRSYDHGTNWTSIRTSGTQPDQFMAGSRDGSYVVTADSQDSYTYIRTSQNYGTNWTSHSGILIACKGLACSSNGQYTYAISSGDGFGSDAPTSKSY